MLGQVPVGSGADGGRHAEADGDDEIGRREAHRQGRRRARRDGRAGRRRGQARRRRVGRPRRWDVLVQVRTAGAGQLRRPRQGEQRAAQGHAAPRNDQRDQASRQGRARAEVQVQAAVVGEAGRGRGAPVLAQYVQQGRQADRCARACMSVRMSMVRAARMSIHMSMHMSIHMPVLRCGRREGRGEAGAQGRQAVECKGRNPVLFIGY